MNSVEDIAYLKEQAQNLKGTRVNLGRDGLTSMEGKLEDFDGDKVIVLNERDGAGERVEITFEAMTYLTCVTPLSELARLKLSGEL